MGYWKRKAKEEKPTSGNKNIMEQYRNNTGTEHRNSNTIREDANDGNTITERVKRTNINNTVTEGTNGAVQLWNNTGTIQEQYKKKTGTVPSLQTTTVP